MTARQTAYLNMFGTVRATCAAHPDAWAGLPDFGDAYAAFVAALDAAETAVAAATGSTRGVTTGKKTARTAISAKAVVLGSALRLWGKKNNDPRLASDAETTEAKLAKMAAKSFVGHVRGLIVRAGKLPATPPNGPLAGYNAPTSFITALAAELDDFTADLIDEPRHARGELKRAAKDVENALEDALEILTEDLDPAADVLRVTQPGFVEEYYSAREIVDPGFLVRDLTVTVSDAETGAPLPGVQALITPGGISKVTAAQGTFYVDDLDAGQYTLALSRPGYASKQVPFAVVDGQGTTVNTTLAADSGQGGGDPGGGGGTDQ